MDDASVSVQLSTRRYLKHIDNVIICSLEYICMYVYLNGISDVQEWSKQVSHLEVNYGPTLQCWYVLYMYSVHTLTLTLHLAIYRY